MMGGLFDAYEQLVARHELTPDSDQRTAAQRLATLKVELESAGDGVGSGLLGRLFGKKPAPIRGVYMWGGVGRGKSMLMDLFYDQLTLSQKRRVHFHAFMLDVHRMMRHWREKDPGDPVPHVAQDIASDVRCLCFDEMVVNNSADAMIMSRLFTALIEQGVVVVATSNRAPQDLYKDGLNREHFLPFIALIHARLDVLALNGATDYRRVRLGQAGLWHVPADDRATAALRAAFYSLTDYSPDDAAHVPSEELDVGGGRTLHVPRSLKGVAVFSFKRLCGEARGAADYLAVAQRFHTMLLVGIPVLGPENRNEAARFVTLIDALYEYKVKLLASAAAEPSDLYPHGDGRFEFDRTVSRLMEMRTESYLEKGHGED